MKEFKEYSWHGTPAVEDGKLTGKTDTDYFYFFCPKCEDTQIMQILDFRFLKKESAKYKDKYRKKLKREFIIAFELYCHKCKLHDCVKVSNIGWQGGKLKDSLNLKKSF